MYPGPGRSITPFALAPHDGDTFREASAEGLVKFTGGSGASAPGVWFGRFEAPGRNGTFLRVIP